MNMLRLPEQRGKTKLAYITDSERKLLRRRDAVSGKKAPEYSKEGVPVLQQQEMREEAAAQKLYDKQKAAGWKTVSDPAGGGGSIWQAPKVKPKTVVKPTTPVTTSVAAPVITPAVTPTTTPAATTTTTPAATTTSSNTSVASNATYVQNNPDLLAHYNANVKASGKSMADWGAQHWNAFGKNEKRKNTPITTTVATTPTTTASATTSATTPAAAPVKMPSTKHSIKHGYKKQYFNMASPSPKVSMISNFLAVSSSLLSARPAAKAPSEDTRVPIPIILSPELNIFFRKPPIPPLDDLVKEDVPVLVLALASRLNCPHVPAPNPVVAAIPVVEAPPPNNQPNPFCIHSHKLLLPSFFPTWAAAFPTIENSFIPGDISGTYLLLEALVERFLVLCCIVLFL